MPTESRHVQIFGLLCYCFGFVVSAIATALDSQMFALISGACATAVILVLAPRPEESADAN